MKKLLIAFVLGATALSSQATVLTFEGLANDSAVPNGYGGLNWNNMRTLNATLYQPSGYKNGRVSGDMVAFNAFALSASVSDGIFDFNGAYLTGAWNDGLNIQVNGYNGATLLYSQTVTVNTAGPTWFSFDYFGINNLTFSSFGGTDNPLYDGGGTHFAMDNFTFNQPASPPQPVPDTSSSLALLGLAMAGVSFARRKLA